MSMFAGVLSANAGPVPEILLDYLRMVARTFGFGPPCLWNGGSVAIIHSQSIVTPEDRLERQPVSSPDEKVTLVLDGRLDNRSDLIHKLRLTGTAAAAPDSALLMTALERWGDDAPLRLVGDFAFATWNAKEHSLHLVCDQMGGRVIYYHRGSRYLMFGTMVNAVRMLVGSPRDLDETALISLLLDRGVGAERTIYKDIARVPPAGRVRFSGSNVRIDRYWKPDPHRQIRLRNDGDYIDAARELLDLSVATRLRSTKPIVAALSGGLDSGAVAATAARLLAPCSLATVTAVPESGVRLHERWNKLNDEWPLAQAVARMHPNMEPHAACGSGIAPEEIDPSALFLFTGGTPRNFLNLAWFGPMKKWVRDVGAGVLLSGVAGNLTLSWSGVRALSNYARAGQWWRVLRETRKLSLRTGQSPYGLLRNEAISPLLPVSWRAKLRRLQNGSPAIWNPDSPINPEFALEMQVPQQLENDRRLGILDVQGSDFDLHVTQLEYFWQGRAAIACQRAYMGYEVRDPLGDLRLLEFCLSLPSDQYLRDGVRRRLARKTLEDRLPTEVVWSKQRGRQCPEWFYRLNRRREAITEGVERLQRSPFARRYLDLRRMKTIMENWPVDAIAAEARLPDLLMVLSRGFEIGRLLLWIEESGPAAVTNIPVAS